MSVSIALPENAYATRALCAASMTRRYAEFLPLGVSARSALRAVCLIQKVCGASTPFKNRPGSQVVWYSIVLGNYLETLAIPLQSGRFFQDSDRDVTVINQTAARTFWPGQDAIGKRIKWGVLQTPAPWFTVIGIVADTEQNSPDRVVLPQFYEPLAHDPRRAMSIVVRSAGASRLSNSLRSTLESMDSELQLSRIQTLHRARGDALTPRRTTTQIVGAFAGAALIFAAVGNLRIDAVPGDRPTPRNRHTDGARRESSVNPRTF